MEKVLMEGIFIAQLIGSRFLKWLSIMMITGITTLLIQMIYIFGLDGSWTESLFSSILRFWILFLPFVFTYYLTSTIKHTSLYTHLLSRGISRKSYFLGITLLIWQPLLLLWLNGGLWDLFLTISSSQKTFSFPFLHLNCLTIDLIMFFLVMLYSQLFNYRIIGPTLAIIPFLTGLFTARGKIFFNMGYTFFLLWNTSPEDFKISLSFMGGTTVLWQNLFFCGIIIITTLIFFLSKDL